MAVSLDDAQYPIRPLQVEFGEYVVNLRVSGLPWTPGFRKLHKPKDRYGVVGREPGGAISSAEGVTALFDTVAQGAKGEDRRHYGVAGLVKINTVGAHRPRWQRESRGGAPASEALDIRIALVFELIVEAHMVHPFEDLVVSG